MCEKTPKNIAQIEGNKQDKHRIQFKFDFFIFKTDEYRQNQACKTKNNKFWKYRYQKCNETQG